MTTARARLEQRGEIPHVDERVDSAGRLQPATKPQSETDEGWLARTLAEVGDGTFTIPATPEEMIARMRELDEEQERIERIVYERKLAALQEQPPSAQRDAREVGLMLRYQRDQMRRAFHKSGATSIEEFAEMADLYVGYVHDILMLDEVD